MSDVIANGLPAGFDIAGRKSLGNDSLANTMYIGRGMSRFGQLAPGQLLSKPYTNTTTPKPAGLYVEFHDGVLYLTDNFDYLVNLTTCDYQWVLSAFGANVTNAVQYESNAGTLYVGRYFDEGSIVVGKIWPKGGIMYYGSGKTTNFYQVLVCNAKPIPPPVCVCAVTSTVKPKSSKECRF
jgi:Protein of unknown function (DUF3421)